MDKTRVAFLLILATTAAGAFWAWRAYQASPVDSADLQQLQELGDLSMQTLNDTLSERLSESTTGAPQERMESQLGLALFRKCAEWTEFNDNHPSDSAEHNRVHACNEYRDYVNTGTVPEGYAPGSDESLRDDPGAT